MPYTAVPDRDIRDVPTFLALVRQNPCLWLGGKPVHGPRHLLNGITFAEDFHDVPVDRRFGGFDFEAFEKWVYRRHNTQLLSVNLFWLADDLTGSDAAGFDRWFEWYDEFNTNPDRR